MLETLYYNFFFLYFSYFVEFQQILLSGAGMGGRGGGLYVGLTFQYQKLVSTQTDYKLVTNKAWLPYIKLPIAGPILDI